MGNNLDNVEDHKRILEFGKPENEVVFLEKIFVNHSIDIMNGATLTIGQTTHNIRGIVPDDVIEFMFREVNEN